MKKNQQTSQIWKKEDKENNMIFKLTKTSCCLFEPPIV